MRRVVIFGATSAIAVATARCWAEQHSELFLVARDPEKLQSCIDDFQTRGAKIRGTLVADLSNSLSQAELFERILSHFPEFDTAFIAWGTLGNQEFCEKSYTQTHKELETNFLSPVALLTVIANHFENKKSGTIGVITSVAGDRGRKSNYIYGTAKGALNIYLQGLRARLSHHGVSVVTIEPGFVDTPMTREVPKNFLFAEPALVGQAIFRAIEQKRNIVYAPWFWRYIMFVIKIIPESIFKKLPL